MDRIALSLIMRGSFSLLLLSLGVYISGNLTWGLVGLVFAWAVVLIGYDIQSATLMLNQISQLQPRWHLKTLARLVWLSLPLGFVMMLISLNTNIPRYFIERYLGERQLGIFAALAYLMVAGNMVVSALGESTIPRLAKHYAAGDTLSFRKLLVKLVAIAALLGGTGVLIVAIAGRQILTFLYQPEYAQQTNLLVWLMVVAAISYMSSFLGYGMTAARYFRIQIPLFAMATGISAIACFWFIPKMGLQGAVIVLFIAAIVQVSFSLGVIIHAQHKLHKYAHDHDVH